MPITNLSTVNAETKQLGGTIYNKAWHKKLKLWHKELPCMQHSIAFSQKIEILLRAPQRRPFIFVQRNSLGAEKLFSPFIKDVKRLIFISEAIFTFGCLFTVTYANEKNKLHIVNVAWLSVPQQGTKNVVMASSSRLLTTCTSTHKKC